jgi:hypothetical protein
LYPILTDDGPNHNDQVVGPIFDADLPSELYAYGSGRNAQQAVVELEEAPESRGRRSGVLVLEFSQTGGTRLIKIDVEVMKSAGPPPCRHNIWYTLFVKALAVAHEGFHSPPLVDVYTNRSGCTFLYLTFCTRDDAACCRIS